MAEDKTPQQAPVQDPHHAYSEEVEQLKELLGRYGTPVLAGVVVAMLIIVGLGTYRSFRASAADQQAEGEAGQRATRSHRPG